LHEKINPENERDPSPKGVAVSFFKKKQPMTQTNVQTIPLRSFTTDQVADLLQVSVKTVHNYNTRGKRLANDLYVKLPKNGTRVQKQDLINFINQFKKNEEIHSPQG
jgi:hypothetical protein